MVLSSQKRMEYLLACFAFQTTSLCLSIKTITQERDVLILATPQPSMMHLRWGGNLLFNATSKKFMKSFHLNIGHTSTLNSLNSKIINHYEITSSFLYSFCIPCMSCSTFIS